MSRRLPYFLPEMRMRRGGQMMMPMGTIYRGVLPPRPPPLPTLRTMEVTVNNPTDYYGKYRFYMPGPNGSWRAFVGTQGQEYIVSPKNTDKRMLRFPTMFRSLAVVWTFSKVDTNHLPDSFKSFGNLTYMDGFGSRGSPVVKCPIDVNHNELPVDPNYNELRSLVTLTDPTETSDCRGSGELKSDIFVSNLNMIKNLQNLVTSLLPVAARGGGCSNAKSGGGSFKKKRNRYNHTGKWERCVLKVKAQNKAVNPYAICTRSVGW